MKANNNIQKAVTPSSGSWNRAIAEDEYSLITFNERTSLVQNFTRHSSTVRSEAALKQAGGRTALYDAVYMGLDQIKGDNNEKKALVLITDGEDNSSRYSITEVREFAKESDVQIYAVGEQGELGYGRSLIQGIVGVDGRQGVLPQQLQ